MIRNSTWVVILLLLVAGIFPLPAGSAAIPLQAGSGQAASPASGCNCNMPMQPAAASSPALPRPAGGTASVPCTGLAVPALPGTATVPVRFSGIRRIYPKNVLDHPERAAVHALIVERPGIDIAGIASALDMNRETLRYHLGILESAMKIVVLRDRGIVRYYENHGRYTLLERKMLRHLWNPTGKEILSLVAAQPGIAQSDISSRIGITPPTVRWYLQRLSADGIIARQHEGKWTRYAMVPEAGNFLTTNTGMPPEIGVSI